MLANTLGFTGNIAGRDLHPTWAIASPSNYAHVLVGVYLFRHSDVNDG
ncbi:hypothetical protein ACWPAB_13620 [Lacticaseibacillus sp. 30]|nr:hypothetical protein [Lacticaseibacillus paracasei]